MNEPVFKVRRSGALLVALATLGAGGASEATSAPPSTEAATTTTTPEPAAPVIALTPGQPFPIPLGVGDQPSLDATNVKPPTAVHPWLIVGDYRSAPGAPSEIAVYLADSAESGWRLAASSGATGPDSITYAVETMADGTEALFGFVDDADGVRPAWWHFDGTTLSAPNIIDYSAVPGEVREAAVGPDGTFYVEILRYPEPGATAVEHARRTPDGTWSAVTLPGIADNRFVADGAAVIDQTVVFTGRGGSAAMAYASTDGGVSFTVADTTEFAGTTTSGLSSVAAGPDGFYAATCSFGYTTNARYAYSANGIAWAARGFQTGADQLVAPLVDEAACNRMAVDSAGGVWLASMDPQNPAFGMVYRGASDEATEFYTIEHEPTGLRFANQPMMAVSDTEVAVVGSVRGGVLAGIASRSDAWAAAAMTAVSPNAGTPGFRESFSGYDSIDEAGRLVGLRTFPAVTQVDSLTVWGARSYPQIVNADGTLSDGSAEVAEATDNTRFVARHSTGDVTVINSYEIEAFDGGSGDVTLSRRPPGGAWGAPELVAGGSGAQFVDGIVTIGDVTIAVGGDSYTGTNQPGNGQPLILYIDEDGVDRINLDVPDAEFSDLGQVCALPDGRAIAFSEIEELPNPQPFVAHIDIASRTAAVVETSLGETAVQTCASTPTAVVAVTADDRIWSTVDGSTFTEAAVLRPGDNPWDVAAGPSGFAIVGSTGPRYDDGFVMFGPTLDQLQRVDVPGLGGPGAQLAAHLWSRSRRCS